MTHSTASDGERTTIRYRNTWILTDVGQATARCTEQNPASGGSTRTCAWEFFSSCAELANQKSRIRYPSEAYVLYEVGLVLVAMNRECIATRKRRMAEPN